jgi:serine protease Do
MLKSDRRSFTFIELVISTLFVLIPLFGQDIPALVKKIRPAAVILYNFNEEGDTVSRGSGFFINAAGDVITCHHAVFDELPDQLISLVERTKVKTVDGESYPVADVIAGSPSYDLVVLKLRNVKKPMYFLTIAPDLPVQGEQILVIGSPEGLEFTVTDGIVSAIRDDEDISSRIQISAPVSDGSSGSPVVNLKGEVVGVITTRLEESENFSFAVSAKLIPELKPLSRTGGRLAKMRSTERKPRK